RVLRRRRHPRRSRAGQRARRRGGRPDARALDGLVLDVQGPARQRVRSLADRPVRRLRAGLPLLELPELDAADLAAAGLRQLGDELDLARVLVRRGHALHVLLERARRSPGSCPGRRTTNAFTIWPRSGWGLPTTALSATAGCSRSALSTSNGPIRYAAERITSSARPVNQKYPSSSRTARSPVAY